MSTSSTTTLPTTTTESNDSLTATPNDPTTIVSTEATGATEATEVTEVTEVMEVTEATEVMDATEVTEATEAPPDTATSTTLAAPETPEEQPADQPQDPPLPSPAVCLRNHLGKALTARIATLSEDDRERLYAADSNCTTLEEYAVSIERAEHGAMSVVQMCSQIDRMRKYQPRGTSRTGRQKQEMEKMYNQHRAKRDDALAEIDELRAELQQRVRVFLNEVDDKAHAQAMANHHDKLPKGVRRHVIDAMQRDDAPKLLRSLYCEEMLERANYSFRANHLDTGEHEDCVTLVELLQLTDHYFVKKGGAVECLGAIREKYGA